MKVNFFSVSNSTCPICGIKNPDNAKFCCMCGKSLEKLNEERMQSAKEGAIPLVVKNLQTVSGNKSIRVFCSDITAMKESVDLLVLSAYKYSYSPTPGTVIGALNENLGISVENLSRLPFVDMREVSGCWLSESVDTEKIKRIGCVDLINTRAIEKGAVLEQMILRRIKAFFCMLDAVTAGGTVIEKIALPVLGTGCQDIGANMILYPLLNEVTEFLRRNDCIKEVIFVERNFEKACKVATVVSRSYQLTESRREERKDVSRPYVFISYSTDGDTESAEMLTRILREKKIDYWYAPEKIKEGAYADAIVKGIRTCTHFVCLVSERSMKSNHVLNEIDLAFKQIEEGLEILPIFLDITIDKLTPSFEYYLSRMQFHNGCPAPNEPLLRAFVESVF